MLGAAARLSQLFMEEQLHKLQSIVDFLITPGFFEPELCNDLIFFQPGETEADYLAIPWIFFVQIFQKIRKQNP